MPNQSQRNGPPPQPKGNKRALGNQGGAPLIYTEAWLQEEARLFYDWMKEEDSLYFKSFAIHRGYLPQRLSEFAEKSPEFSEALEFAKAWQEQKLVIDAVRNLLNRCWFDEVKCAKGITALESYKKQWNDRHGCWSSLPVHNFASHGADAFRMLAVGIRKLANKGLSIDDKS